MKMFNKNRKSFVNNNNRRHDRNSYQSNDRNNKFSRKNGGRKKIIKSEQFHEEEDATPWHVMKQNLKPSISIKNPEIEDDWNEDERQKSRAAKQAFMRQKDERHRKFVIENERKTVSKWDTFSDIEQSDNESKKTTNYSTDESDDEQIVEGVKQIVDVKPIEKISAVSKKSKKSKLQEIIDETQPSKKIKINHTNLPQVIVKQNGLGESLLVEKKSKKKSKHFESHQDSTMETEIKETIISQKKLKTEVIQSDFPQETDIETKSDNALITKKKIIETINQCKNVEESVQPAKKSKTKSKQVELSSEDLLNDAVDHIFQEKSTNSKKEEIYFCNIQPEETFLESLASKKLNEPLLFESAEITKSGPRCFACRQYGHSLKQCRDFDNKSTRICIKCGSSEHAYQNCTVHKGRVFKFASCFICKETGHISSQCREKKNGVYPDGGNCRYCSSIEHLGFNCTRRPGRKKKRKFLSKRNFNHNDKLRKVQNSCDRRGTGRVQQHTKDNKIKRNFK